MANFHSTATNHHTLPLRHADHLSYNGSSAAHSEEGAICPLLHAWAHATLPSITVTDGVHHSFLPDGHRWQRNHHDLNSQDDSANVFLSCHTGLFAFTNSTFVFFGRYIYCSIHCFCLHEHGIKHLTDLQLVANSQSKLWWSPISTQLLILMKPMWIM